MGSYSRARYRFRCCVLYMLYVMISLCMFSYFHPGGRGWVSVVSSLSMAGDIVGVCCLLLLHL